MELGKKTFLVTGGGSGLGAATARLFSKSGSNVVILDMNEELGRPLATELGGFFVKTDVTSEESVAYAVSESLSAYGQIHGAINCAGIGVAKKVISKKGPMPLSDFAKVVQVNLIGTFNVIRLVSEAMTKTEPGDDGERGIIINTASVAAFDGQIGQAAYSASKGGVVSMTLPIARELAEFGIRVMTIAPGTFDTPMLGQLSDEIRKSLGQQVPFPKRLGSPDEYALLAKHIVENRMLNGEVIRLDGSIRMAPK